MIPSAPRAVRKSREFADWHESLKDGKVRAVIDARIKRVQFGLYGDVKPLGGGISELRVDYGPGYRVYFTETARGQIVLLLAGGNKATQERDIDGAREILRSLKQKQAIGRRDMQGRAKGEEP